MSTSSAAYCALKDFLDYSYINESIPEKTKKQPEKYFKRSQTQRIANELDAEIIFRPFKRLILYDDYLRLKNNLWSLLMNSCQKSEFESTVYESHINIEKVSINVDYLIIIKKKLHPIAFISGTFINRHLFYINCAMILPDYQLSAIGSIITAILCRHALTDGLRLNGQSPYIICRTQNMEVASALLHSMENGIISTEPDLSNEYKNYLKETATYLDCQIDLNSGISRNVYPDGLPKGHRIKNRKIIESFSLLGERDACYILGRVKERLVNAVMNKFVYCQSV